MKLIDVEKELTLSIELTELFKYYNVLTRVVENMSNNDDKEILGNFRDEISTILNDVRGW